MRRVHKNLCPATISASIMAANMWKNSLKNVESDNNKILHETLFVYFFTAKRYLLSEQASYIHKLHVAPSVGCPKPLTCCIRSFLVQLFLRIAGVSYGRFMATRCKLICQRIFSTVGDRWEGRDLNGETVSSGQRTVAVR